VKICGNLVHFLLFSIFGENSRQVNAHYCYLPCNRIDGFLHFIRQVAHWPFHLLWILYSFIIGLGLELGLVLVLSIELRLVLHRVVVSVSTFRSRDVSTSRLGLLSTKIVTVSVSAINVSCPRPIFRQILQVTIIKLIKSVVAVNESLADLV